VGSLRRRTLAGAAVVLAWAALHLPLSARSQALPDTPPIDLSDPAIIKEGAELYGQTCRYCHGKDGQGGRGPTLRGRGFDFRHVFDRITNGYPPMPAFNRVYSPDQVWKIVAFVQSMK
jgi:mono/diheme cytochrome c family protein